MVLLCVTLAVITLAVYWQVGDHEFLNYDDNVYITENSHVANGLTGPSLIWAFTSVHASNWHPITWLSHMADVQFYGVNPRGHHLTNVVIHIISTVLLLLLFFRSTSSLWQSCFVAALFALHPLHVESVAWAAERKDVLSAFFWFLTLLLYVEYVERKKSSLYLLSLLSFVLGLMSKPMLVTVPVVMLLLDFWPLNRLRPIWQPRLSAGGSALIPILKEKTPFFATSLFSVAVTIYAQHRGDAIRSFDEISCVLRIENAVTAYLNYIAKAFWPRDLAVFYPYPTSVPLWHFLCSLLALLLITVAAILFRRRHPYLPVGWFWFLITLLPVIGIIQVGNQSMADRYSYIPLTGLFIMAAWGVPVLTKELRYRQGILAILGGAAIIAFSALTWHQLGYWRDSITLFRHAIQVTSNNDIAHNNLGGALAMKGDLDAAIKEFQEALTIDPSYFEVHDHLGLALAKKGDLDAAINEYQKALAVSPNWVEAHNHLGVAFAKKGDLDAAISQFQITLTINPDFYDAKNNLGLALTLKRMHDDALK